MKPKLNLGDVVLVLHYEIYPNTKKALAAAKEIGLDKENTLILRIK